MADGAHSHGGGFMGPSLGAVVALILGAYVVERVARPVARAAAPVGRSVAGFIDMLTYAAGGVVVLAAALATWVIVYRVRHRHDPKPALTVNRVPAAPASRPPMAALPPPGSARLAGGDLHVHFHGNTTREEQAAVIAEARRRLDAGRTGA